MGMGGGSVVNNPPISSTPYACVCFLYNYVIDTKINNARAWACRWKALESFEIA